MVNRGDYASAATLYKEILRADSEDWFALLMLSQCLEQDSRHGEALRFAEQALRAHPESFMALRCTARLAVATQEHEKAAEYVRRALALPEVQREIPEEGVLPRALLWLVQLVSRLPGARQDEVRELAPGAQALRLQEWKRWAEHYLSWQSTDPPKGRNTIH